MTVSADNIGRENTTPSVENIIVGGGEMGALIRAFDWFTTPLGPIETWPQSLRSAISILLPSKAQICLFWGKAFTTFYNDAYRPVLGVKHPHVLGVPAWECWSEIWDGVLGPLFNGVVTTGEAFWAQDHPFFLHRYGFTEETYFDVSYDPVRDETGEVGGIFCIVNETTDSVLGERRLRILRDLGERTAEGKTPEEACQNAVQIFANNLADIPFSLLYLLDEWKQGARLVGSSGVESETTFAPSVITLNDANTSEWSLATVASTGQSVTLTDLSAHFDTLPAGPWTEPPHTAVVLPLPSSGQSQIAGFLILGISSRLMLDDGYIGFSRLVAVQVATAIINARAYAEERKRAEALAELDRAKTEFFSNVSHEFRTPLTLLLGPLDAMLSQDNESTLLPHQRETLEVARRNGLRLLKLVNMVLDFSRIQSNRIQASFEPTDLAALTTDLASGFRSAIERVGLRLIVDCPPSATPVYIDHEMWEKIVLNLLSNAFKFTFDGAITVSMSWLPEQVELRVMDTGVGIEADELPNIFERFHRVRGVRARTYEGSGIGLTLVQELVHVHGGSIAVISEVDKGTTFTIRIPLGAAHLPREQVRSARTTSSASSGAASYVEEALRWDSDLLEEAPTLVTLNHPDSEESAHVLVVDDNADMRDYLRRLLAQRYTVETVTDGVAALKAIQQRLPNLVVTDVMMPSMDGFALIQQLRADPNTQTLPVILLSARSGEEARIEGLESGADDYLVKPFSARELLARIGAQLEMARLRQSLLVKEQAARAEAETANMLKLKFLGMISHELRTPLASIKGFATTLIAEDVTFTADEQRQFASIINEETDKLTNLVDHLLDLSRLQAGTLSIHVLPVTWQSIVDSTAIELLQLTAKHQLDIEIAPDLPEVKADPQRIGQVLVNLVNNSVKFSPQGTKITLQAHTHDAIVQIDVADVGAGIPIEKREFVFEAFRQLEMSSFSQHKGAGLGLAICKGIVEAHQGQIWIQERSDPGTTISFTLPIAFSD